MGETVKPCLGLETEVSVLMNFFHYLIDGAFIFKEGDSFRLVVQKYGKIGSRTDFDTFGEAQMALLEFFGYKEEEILQCIAPVWSDFSHPQELTLNHSLQTVFDQVLEVECC